MFGTCVRALSAALSGAAVIVALMGEAVGIEYAAPISLALYAASVIAILSIKCQRRAGEEKRDMKDLPSAIRSRPIREPGE